MKRVIILTCWACLALCQLSFAQAIDETYVTDTLTIRLQGRNQVIITGKIFRDLQDYKRGDSLLKMFLNDFNRATSDSQIPESTQRIHYLAGPDSRRLKAAADPYTEGAFDFEQERLRTILDLPPYHYTIYDLVKQVNIDIYLEDGDAISMLQNLSIGQAIHAATENKSNMRNSYYLMLAAKADSFVVEKTRGNRSFEMSAFASGGLILIGNSFSPTLITNIAFDVRNKFNNPTFRVELNYSGFILTNYHENSFTNFKPGYLYGASILLNPEMFNTLSSSNWFGVTGGAADLVGYNSSKQLHYCGGIVGTYHNIRFTFSSIRVENNPGWKNDGYVYMLSASLPF